MITSMAISPVLVRPKKAGRHALFERSSPVLHLSKAGNTRRLYQQVADEIRSLIQANGLAPGSRLPPERDLAHQLGVSRPSLREALISLEIDGAVQIRTGSGIYVCAPAERGLSPHFMGDSPSELMDARSAIESSVVVLACARSTPEQLVMLRQTIADMASNIKNGRSPLELDRHFHVQIAEMAGNTVLTRIIGQLFNERFSPISVHISQRFESSATWSSAFDEHTQILDALENKNPLAAQAAMISHLKSSHDRWNTDDT